MLFVQSRRAALSLISTARGAVASSSSSSVIDRLCPPARTSSSARLGRPSTRPMSSSFPSEFQAWRVFPSDDGESFEGRETTVATTDLPPSKRAAPEDHILVRVTHSSLNYKDALSAAGNKGVTRNFPHTPGVDAAGTVLEAAASGGSPARGESVVVTGYDLGMNADGGFGELICVPSSWAAPLPAGWTPRAAMVYGTAGLTAGLLVKKLVETSGAKPADGPVLVTGSSGAVGSVVVELMAKLGFEVVAMSGKTDRRSFLESLGASRVVGRDALEPTKKPMVRPEFAHGVDTVGGAPLVELLKRIRPGGSVSCCGLVAGPALETTVLPFILRGVNLLGVDSVEIPLERKREVWEKLAGEWRCPKTEGSARDIGRHELGPALAAFLKGSSHGKVVLDHGLTQASTSQSKM